MSDDSLGSGLYLDDGFDFDVDTTGDLKSSSGSDELQKDISYQLILVLSEYIGKPLRPGVRSEVVSKTIDTLSADERVQAIDRGTINVARPDSESLAIRANVVTNDETEELIFNI